MIPFLAKGIQDLKDKLKIKWFVLLFYYMLIF